MAFSLFGNNRDKDHHDNDELKATHTVVQIPVASISPNQFQPRLNFNQEALEELAQTIKEHGLLQPIILRKQGDDRYEIIAGERRFRAVSLLGWEEVPAIVETMTDDETASMALIENLQREELSAIEEAKAYQDLMGLNDITQSELAEGVGKSQSFVANKLRLLKLEPAVQRAIMNHEITERHGRALLGLAPVQQTQVLKQIKDGHLTVSATEALVEKLTSARPKKKRATRKGISGDTRLAVNTIRQSVKMIKDNGMTVITKEEDSDDSYRIVIEIPKES